MDLIFINGKIITMDASIPQVEAAYIKDETIISIGTNSDILSYKNNGTKIIDLEGRLMVPGFNDSHMHLLNYGSSLLNVNLVGVRSIEEMIERTTKFIVDSNINSNNIIQGRGWNHDYFTEKRFPNRYDLDKISTTQPIMLTRACGHVSVVNSKALEIAGITKNTPQVDGGHFDIDENGELLGIFRENALSLVYDQIPEPSVENIKKMIMTAAANANTQGITSVQSDDLLSVTDEDFTKVIRAYTELRDEGKLTVRVNEQCLLDKVENLNKFLNMGYRTGKGDELFKIGPLKLLADGSLGARTAYMCKPYSDDPSTSGIPVYTQEDLDNLVITAHNAGMQVAVHCIGDKAMYMVFESIEKAQNQNYIEDPRHSIVHCQITDEILLNKFKEFNVIAHIQPIFLDYDLHIVEDRVGQVRAKTTYNWKGLLDRGVHIACGSDCPVENFDVLPGIYSAVTRKDLKGYPENGWLPEQSLTVMEALHGFTLGAAYASFEENLKGSVTPGKLADLVVLSEDIFEIDPDAIKDVKVEMTFIGGKLMYKR
jgi:predicted amidohydrolase YtcJ